MDDQTPEQYFASLGHTLSIKTMDDEEFEEACFRMTVVSGINRSRVKKFIKQGSFGRVRADLIAADGRVLLEGCGYGNNEEDAARSAMIHWQNTLRRY